MQVLWNGMKFHRKEKVVQHLLTNLLNQKIKHLLWKLLNLNDIMLKSNPIQLRVNEHIKLKPYSFIDTCFSFSLFFVMNNYFSRIALQHSYAMNLMVHESICWAWHEMKWKEKCEVFPTLVYLLFDYNYVTYKYK
jgi:hypothetical protein